MWSINAELGVQLCAFIRFSLPRVLQSWLGLLRSIAVQTQTTASETPCVWIAYEQVDAMLLKRKQGMLLQDMSVHLVGVSLLCPQEEFSCCYCLAALPAFSVLRHLWLARKCLQWYAVNLGAKVSWWKSEWETGLKWCVCCVRLDRCVIWQVQSVRIC